MAPSAFIVASRVIIVHLYKIGLKIINCTATTIQILKRGLF